MPMPKLRARSLVLVLLAQAASCSTSSGSSDPGAASHDGGEPLPSETLPQDHDAAAGDDAGTPSNAVDAGPGDDRVVEIASMENHTCARRSEGRVICWGNNQYAQLGITGTTPQGPGYSADVTDAVSIGVGGGHTCVARKGGSTKCWGATDSGQATTPIPTLTNAASVHLGHRHSCALTKAGTLACWGDNAEGQLGDGTRDGDGSVPTDPDAHSVPHVIAGLSNIVAVSSGPSSTCVIVAGGQLKCWGGGRLGDGSFYTAANSPTSPISIPGVTNATQVKSVAHKTCVRQSDGTVSCWGYRDNHSGGAGQDLTPVSVAGINDAIQVAPGTDHTCALRSNKTVTCWGRSDYGQLGNGSTSSVYAPTPVAVTGLSNIVQVVSGGLHSCALDEAGDVWCWGRNFSKQLGHGQATMTETLPVKVLLPPK